MVHYIYMESGLLQGVMILPITKSAVPDNGMQFESRPTGDWVLF